MLRQRRFAGLLAAALTLSPAVGQTVRKSLVIAVDGLRPDAIAPADAPYLDSLIAGGAYSLDAQCEDLTFSGPNHSTILHGVHRDRHNVTTNDYSNNRLTDWPDYLSRLEEFDSSLNSIRVHTWDAAHYSQPTSADLALFYDYIADGDERATQDVVRILRGTHPTVTLDPDALFIFLSDVDVAGHTYGFDPESAGYLTEIANTDGQIGRMLEALEHRPDYLNENWQIVITSDHGGSPDGSHGGGTPEKRRIPFIVAGPTVPPGVVYPQPKNVDVARTVLAHMQATIDPAWQLDGHAVGVAPTSPPPLRFQQNLLFNGGGEYDRGFADWLPDQHISGWDDPGPNGMTLVRYDSPGGWPALSDPGPPERGSNFFCAGSMGDATIVQELDLAPLSPSIDAGWATYRLSAYLGGYMTQRDQATVRIRFRSAAGTDLASALIGPVTPADRANQTALLFRAADGPVPVGTRRATVELRSQRFDGSATDGYADNLEFAITRAGCIADLDRNRRVDLTDLATLLTNFGRTGDASYEQGELDGDGSVTLSDLSSLLARFGAVCE